MEIWSWMHLTWVLSRFLSTKTERFIQVSAFLCAENKSHKLAEGFKQHKSIIFRFCTSGAQQAGSFWQLQGRVRFLTSESAFLHLPRQWLHLPGAAGSGSHL